MKLRKNLKAVSPLIATIILIAITIAGGLLVYALFTSTAGVGSAKAQVQIDTMDLVTSGGDVVFTSTIKNGGNKPALNVTVQLYTETDVYVYDAAPLQPGQTVAFTEAPAAEYIIGNAYLVTVTAEYTDGSTSSIVASVTCRG